MVPIGDVDNLDALADVLGCKVGISRLILVCHWELKSYSIWNLILEKLER